MDGSKRDDACCKNCFFMVEMETDGQIKIICCRDGSSKDDDTVCHTVCRHWTRQD